MGNGSDKKICIENLITHLVFNNLFPLKNAAVHEIVWNNRGNECTTTFWHISATPVAVEKQYV
jgi:hypothetical protein